MVPFRNIQTHRHLTIIYMSHIVEWYFWLEHDYDFAMTFTKGEARGDGGVGVGNLLKISTINHN